MAPLVRAEALHSSEVDADCVTFDLDLGGRAYTTAPVDDPPGGLTLQRFRTELGLRAPGDVQARVAFLADRASAAAEISGQSYVPTLQIAEARWDLRSAGFAVAGGMVDDIWVMVVQAPWARREIMAPMPTDFGLMDRADVGGWASFTSPESRVATTASVTTGEGLGLPEANARVNVSGVVRVRPMAQAAPFDLELAALARAGSEGVDPVLDNRAGLAAILRHDVVVAGADALLRFGGPDAWDLAGGVSLWARLGDKQPATGWIRVDERSSALDVQDAGSSVFAIGGGPRLPIRPGGGPAYLAVGWEARGPGLVPFGDQAGSLFFLQLGARLQAVR